MLSVFTQMSSFRITSEVRTFGGFVISRIQLNLTQRSGRDRGGIIQGGEPMNLNASARKLQKALCLKGRYIKINQIQFYSTHSKRMLTKYILKETVEKNGKQKERIIIETFKLIDIIHILADMLDGGE